jgi:DNA-binding MarR family transcriptional regulator
MDRVEGMKYQQDQAASESRASSSEQLRSGLGFRLSRAGRLLRQRWSHALEDLNITPTHAAVLRALAEQPGQGVRDLARMLSTDPTSVKHHLDLLEARLLVASPQSTRKGERRPFTLTLEGEHLVREIHLRQERQTDFLKTALGVEGQRALDAALTSLERTLLPDLSPKTLR